MPYFVKRLRYEIVSANVQCSVQPWEPPQNNFPSAAVLMAICQLPISAASSSANFPLDHAQLSDSG
jgi:hypothetical protein